MSKFYTYVGQNRDNGGQVLHAYYDEAGVRHEDTIKFKPMLGKLTKPKPGKEYLYHDIFGNPLQWKQFDSIDLYRNFMDEYDEVDFYGTMKEDYQFLGEKYPGKIDYDLSLVRPFWIDIETGRISGKDWAESHDAPITSIAIKDARNNKFFVMSTKMWSKEKSILPKEIDLSRVTFKHCKDEEGIFKYLRQVLHREKPDMLIGFYSDYFDFPYIIKRGTYVMGKKFMQGFSPWQRVTSKKKVDRETGEIYDYFNEIQGIPLMDFRKMYMKFIYTPRESYSLDFLATEELGDTKLDYSEYDSIFDMWDKDPQKYIDYNIYDVELLDQMDKKLELVDLSCTIAYFAKTNFTDTLGTVGIWDSIFYNTLKEKNVMIPPKHTGVKEKYAGAYVFEPERKIHNWLIAVDLKSLYPHIQQQYNISPESLVEDRRMELDIDITEDLDERYLNEEIPTPKDTIMAANGCYFRKDKEGIVPGLLREIYDNRTVAKKEMIEWKVKLQAWKEENDIDVKAEFIKYKGPEELRAKWAEFEKHITTKNNYQMAMKILMNSEYGALANIHFRYYDIRFASAITQCAQLALKWAAKRLEENPAKEKYRYHLIYGDTDSLYISVEHIVEQIKMRRPDITDADIVKQINGFVAKIIQPILTKGYEDLAKYVNANENRMFMAHEKTITNALWTAKKRYALNVLWDEGVTYPKPKLKVKGIEIVRSSTPKIIRDALKESVAIMLEDEDLLQAYVKKQKTDFKNNKIIDIAFPRTANNIEKWMVEGPDGSLSHTKGTPIGVRAAIVYNNTIRGEKNFPIIMSGEKIKYVFLRMPNIYDQNVIAFLRRIPEDAIKYVDWDLQFEKSFMSVIDNIYRKMGKVFKKHQETNLSEIF
jgi:DNA polymerase elongation subunit (family B)